MTSQLEITQPYLIKDLPADRELAPADPKDIFKFGPLPEYLSGKNLPVSAEQKRIQKLVDGFIDQFWVLLRSKPGVDPGMKERVRQKFRVADIPAEYFVEDAQDIAKYSQTVRPRNDAQPLPKAKEYQDGDVFFTPTG